MNVGACLLKQITLQLHNQVLNILIHKIDTFNKSFLNVTLDYPIIVQWLSSYTSGWDTSALRRKTSHNTTVRALLYNVTKVCCLSVHDVMLNQYCWHQHHICRKTESKIVAMIQHGTDSTLDCGLKYAFGYHFLFEHFAIPQTASTLQDVCMVKLLLEKVELSDGQMSLPTILISHQVKIENRFCLSL